MKLNHLLQKHGDGVKRWSLIVDDVKHAFEMSTKNGAVPVRNPKKFEDENGTVYEAAIKLYDDSEIVFINRDNYKGLFKPGFGKPVQKINIEIGRNRIAGS